jgi:hypothetical protein
VAAPVALGFGKNGPPLVGDRVHRQAVSGHRSLRHHLRGRRGEPPHGNAEEGGTGGVGEAISRPQEGRQGGGGVGGEAMSSAWRLAVEVGDEARRR